MLVVVTATGLEHRMAPNRVVLPAAARALAANLALAPSVGWPLAELGASGFLLAAPGGLGMGDLKLALLLGAALGSTVGVATMLGFPAAFVPALALIAPAMAPDAEDAASARSVPRPRRVVALFRGRTLLSLDLPAVAGRRLAARR